MAILLQLAIMFGIYSLLSFGGGNAVIPDMRRVVVDVDHWMTARQFLDCFAISRALPGPGSMLVALIGQKAAGVPGALVAFVTMFGPPCLIIYVVSRGWHRAAQAAWRAIVEQALAPVAVGLTFASGLSLMRGTEDGWLPWCITIATTAAFAFTDVNPLALLGIGAVAALAAGG
jgi:chromate transporter